MPLPKRILFDLDSYKELEQFQDSDQAVTFESRSFSQLVGACRQLSYLSTYALEIFTNITALSDDINERMKVVIVKTDRIISNQLKEVEKHVRNSDITPDLSISFKKYVKPSNIIMPPIFVKATNCPGIEQQYTLCRPPPQLWRIESITNTECFTNYSNPGYFFQEWLRTELLKQEEDKLNRKKTKAIKKAQKLERRKLREERAAAHASMDFEPMLVQPSGRRMSSLLADRESRAFEQPAAAPTTMTAAAVPLPVTSASAAMFEAVEPPVKEPVPSLKKKGIAAVFGFLSRKHDADQDEHEDAEPKDKEKDKTTMDAGRVEAKSVKAVKTKSKPVPPPPPDAPKAQQPTTAVIEVEAPPNKESRSTTPEPMRKRPSVSMEALSLQMLTGSNAARRPSIESDKHRSSVISVAPPPKVTPKPPPKLKDAEMTKLLYTEEVETADLFTIQVAPKKKAPPPPPPKPSQPLLLSKDKPSSPNLLLRVSMEAMPVDATSEADDAQHAKHASQQQTPKGKRRASMIGTKDLAAVLRPQAEEVDEAAAIVETLKAEMHIDTHTVSSAADQPRNTLTSDARNSHSASNHGEGLLDELDDEGSEWRSVGSHEGTVVSGTSRSATQSQRGAPPPPPPRPSTVSAMSQSMHSIQSEKSVAPPVREPEPEPVNPMLNLLETIKLGKVALKSTTDIPPPAKLPVKVRRPSVVPVSCVLIDVCVCSKTKPWLPSWPTAPRSLEATQSLTMIRMMTTQMMAMAEETGTGKGVQPMSNVTRLTIHPPTHINTVFVQI